MAKKKVKKKVAKKKRIKKHKNPPAPRMVKEKGVMVPAKPEKAPIIIQYFYPPDGRTKFYKSYMVPGAEVEMVEQFGSHETRKKYAMRNLVKVRFVGQEHTDMLSPSCLKRRLKKEGD